MSITDSTTTLDTAWTEQTIVEFTAGVLSNLAACVSEVESKLQRGTLGAATKPTLTQVQNWLKRAKMELAEIKDYTFDRKYASATLSAGDYRVSLPPDYNGELIVKDTTNDHPLPVVGENVFNNKYPDLSAEAQNNPQHCCVKNMELWIAPPPDSSTVIEIEYQRSGAETTADDFAWLPELERFRCCDYATYEAFEALHDYAKADRFLGKFGQGLQKSARADGRRKWAGQISCLSVFQQHALQSHQRFYRRY